MASLPLMCFSAVTFFSTLLNAAPVQDNRITLMKVTTEIVTEKDQREFQELTNKGYELSIMMPLLMCTYVGAKQLHNPCSLNDYVRELMPASIAENNLTQPYHTIPRTVVLNQALKAVAKASNSYRSNEVLEFVNPEENIYIFIDQNQEHVFDNTVLRNYVHLYFWTEGANITQMRFLNLLPTDNFLARDPAATALKFLKNADIGKYPWKLMEYENLLSNNTTSEISELRLRTATLLKKQGLFWEDEKEYISNMLSAAFNGPESVGELEQLKTMVKIFSEDIRGKSTRPNKDYDLLCAEWNQTLDKTFSSTL